MVAITPSIISVYMTVKNELLRASLVKNNILYSEVKVERFLILIEAKEKKIFCLKIERKLKSLILPRNNNDQESLHGF